ncbi:MFS transporter [Nakamurella lactea]|uniref:MFS transporter n=1 Tax=Nakamurella lactea TaxID=459515 RepID=UPI0003F73815|nr:MFS transporter [Nakamurella lactea]
MTTLHLRLTYAVLLGAALAFALLQAMVMPVLPTIQDHLGTDSRQVAWVVSSYLLASAVATPLVGRLGDVLGRKRVLVAALCTLAVGSLAAAYAPNLGLMVAARVLQGVGAGVVPLSIGIVRDEFPAHRIPAAVGTIAALTGIGAGVGLVLAGPLIDLLGYRSLFLVPMGLTAATAVLAALVLRESPRQAGTVSWLPAPFLSLAVTALILATIQGGAWGWADPRMLGLYAATVGFGICWVVAERHAERPLIDLDMLKRPAVRSVNLVTFLLGFVMFGVYAYVPQFLQAPRSTGYGFGASVTMSGLVMAPMAACVFVGGVTAARASARFGPRLVILTASAVMALSLVVLLAARTQLWQIGSTLAVYGVALGVNLAAVSMAVVLAVSAKLTAVASAVNVNMRTIGGAIGAAMIATVITAGVEPGGPPAESGYLIAFATLAVIVAVASVLALTIPGNGDREPLAAVA